jgi:glutaredoxin
LTTTTRLFIALSGFFLVAATQVLAAAAEPPPQVPNEQAASLPADIEVFVRENCPHCAKAKEFLSSLKQQQPELKIVIRDVFKEPAALEQLVRIAKKQGIVSVSVPAFKIGEQMIIGFSEEASTSQLILSSLALARDQSTDVRPAPTIKPEAFAIDFFGYGLSLDQAGLPLFTMAMGLLDGFNPCSMWVLILMISLLAPMNNRSRMFAIAGTFVAVQGLAYFVFLAAWLNLFLLIGLSRTSEIIIAAVALVAGAINLKDFWALGWGVSLSIPTAAKPGIYTRIRRILQADNLAGAMIGAIILAILVQLVELMCTSGFPALFTRILTRSQLDGLSYYGYLVLYDLVYMLDDVIVLAIGIITLSQRRLQEKEGRWLKLISGLAMVGLGAYLLLAPH